MYSEKPSGWLKDPTSPYGRFQFKSNAKLQRTGLSIVLVIIIILGSIFYFPSERVESIIHYVPVEAPGETYDGGRPGYGESGGLEDFYTPVVEVVHSTSTTGQAPAATKSASGPAAESASNSHTHHYIHAATASAAKAAASSASASASGSVSAAAHKPSATAEHSSMSEPDPTLKAKPSGLHSYTKEEYIEAVLREPVEGLFDPAPIQKLCAAAKIQEGLVYHCHFLIGGYGNLANMWLSCMRYAIEAGAWIVVLPRLGERAEDLIDLGTNGALDLTTIFDVDYFLEMWNIACPDIVAMASDTKIKNLPSQQDSHYLIPYELPGIEHDYWVIEDHSGWRGSFDSWVADVSGGRQFSAEQPLRVFQTHSYGNWNRERQDPALVNSLPRMIRTTLQTRRLAATVLWNMEKLINRRVVSDAILESPKEPAKPPASSYVNALKAGRIQPRGFVGAHLRVGADAAAAEWPGYETQAPYFISEAKQQNMSAIYLATDGEEYRKAFAEEAAQSGVAVYTKEDILTGYDLQELNDLRWDQKALVDWEVLMHSSYFHGFSQSSFSYSLVLRRATLPESNQTVPKTWLSEDEDWRDGLSALAGIGFGADIRGWWP